MASDIAVAFDPNSARSSDIESWLRHALTEYKKTGSRWSFSPISLLIGNRDDLAHDLHAYLESLQDSAKKRWSTAILSLLSDQSIRDEDTLIMLVDLAVLSRSKDVLKPLPRLAQRTDAKARLLDRIINAVLELPLTIEASRKCLEAVARSTAFPERSANTVFLTLCRIAPDDWIDHARLVSKKIPKPSNGEDRDWDFLHDCAQSVLLAIGLDKLGSHWYEFVHDSNLNWLRDIFMSGNLPLVKEVKDKLTSSLIPDDEVEIQSAPASD